MANKVRKAARRIRALLDCGGTANVDPFRNMLADEVARAAEEMAALRGARPAFRRAVASRLSDAGYDAAVCQTRWRATREVAAGNYEFIDVVTAVTAGAGKSATAGEQRYIVDVGFAAEFVVARPTEDYDLVLSVLPNILVAPPKVVQKVVKVAAKAARRSLKSQGLAVPPWRKKRFVGAKWLGPHRRTPDDTASVVAPRATAAGAGAGDAACRTVGFVLGTQIQPWLVRT
ncbi:hypothetical protein E2562_033728 [Oryza meyeriana var. granulata]|uniref:Uncharacterized protein n=1 Tax=Oryza meyeriana var. granulata TaxID=110450 RepID=A0A6G1CBX3_9ORYZ|nr:hypothetical protein E2562_033728 [Oryza meyeriana var. granulata]